MLVQFALSNEAVLAKVAALATTSVDNVRAELMSCVEASLKPLMDAVETGPHRLIPNRSASRMWFVYCPKSDSVRADTFTNALRQFVENDLNAGEAFTDSLLTPANLALILSSVDPDGDGVITITEARNCFMQKDVAFIDILQRIIAQASVPPFDVPPPPQPFIGYHLQLATAQARLADCDAVDVTVVHGVEQCGMSSFLQQLCTIARAPAPRDGSPSFPGGIFCTDQCKMHSADGVISKVCLRVGVRVTGSPKEALQGWCANVSKRTLIAVDGGKLPVKLVLEALQEFSSANVKFVVGSVGALPASSSATVTLTGLGPADAAELLSFCAPHLLSMTPLVVSGSGGLPGVLVQQLAGLSAGEVAQILGRSPTTAALSTSEPTPLSSADGTRVADFNGPPAHTVERLQQAVLALTLSKATEAAGSSESTAPSSESSQGSSVRGGTVALASTASTAASAPSRRRPSALNLAVGFNTDVLRELTVFPGAFDLAAAAAVLRVPEATAAGHIAGLVRHQLLRAAGESNWECTFPTSSMVPSADATLAFVRYVVQQLNSANASFKSSSMLTGLLLFDTQQDSIGAVLKLATAGGEQPEAVQRALLACQCFELLLARLPVETVVLVAQGLAKLAAGLYDDFSPEVGVAKAHVGVVLRAQGRTAEAMKAFKDARLIFETERGDVRVVPALLGLSELLADDGKHGEATALCRQALDIMTAAASPNAVDIATCRGRVADAMLRQGNVADARVCDRLPRQRCQCLRQMSVTVDGCLRSLYVCLCSRRRCQWRWSCWRPMV